MQLGPTIGVIDIGSNSVRLVVYEALTRSPTPIFNEKTLCGLGRNVLTSGRLADDAVAHALASIAGSKGELRVPGRRCPGKAFVMKS